MRQDLTDITLVIDRSGSMCSCQSDAEGGVNAFIADQKKASGRANLTLVQFDHEYEFVHTGKDIADVGEFQLHPRGNTALLDAVGRAIKETGSRLAAMDESERPALVVFVIVTDGQENASREFTKAQIREAVTHQTETYHWKFLFLGANTDAFAEAGSMGIGANNAANFTTNNAGAAIQTSSSMLRAARGFSACGQSADAISMDFLPDQREELVK